VTGSAAIERSPGRLRHRIPDGSTDATKVVAKMKELPIDDFYTKGTVREDGRVMRPYYLLEVKKPSESKYPFDYLKLLATVSAEDAARPLSKSECPMVKH
jgi:branched-chain amino acid transport system substrate-binding protein